MDRCAIFVDAGYLIAEGAKGHLAASAKRGDVAIDYAALVERLDRRARKASDLPLLRIYWYDGAVDGVPTTEQLAISALPDVKLRVGRITGGRQKGVDALVYRDLSVLARERAIVTAFVLAGDEDAQFDELRAQHEQTESTESAGQVMRTTSRRRTWARADGSRASPPCRRVPTSDPPLRLVFVTSNVVRTHGGEALAGLLQPGNAGSNTTADHITILDMALAALPEHARPRPGEADSPRVLVRTDAAGATHGFAAAARDAGCGFSLGFPIDEDVQAAIPAAPDQAWTPAYDIDGQPRDGAWVADITDLLDLSKWPTGARVIVRRERPHPGAQLRFTDADGHRFTAFITDTAGGQLADLEVTHRSHARVEDRSRCGKTTGLRNLPCRQYAENKVWLELCLAAADLLTWAQALCFTGELARCEPATFRYRICSIAGRLSRSGRRWHLHLDRDWPWATHLAVAFARLKAAPWPG